MFVLDRRVRGARRQKAPCAGRIWPAPAQRLTVAMTARGGRTDDWRNRFGGNRRSWRGGGHDEVGGTCDVRFGL